jgi:hypothetical protein
MGKKKVKWKFTIKLSFQQMHYLLKHKMLQFVFKCFFAQLLHVSVPLDHHQGAHIRTLLKLQLLYNIS